MALPGGGVHGSLGYAHLPGAGDETNAAVTALALVGGCLAVGAGTQLLARADAPAPLPSGTYCQGPQPTQPSSGPTHVLDIVLENESPASIDSSPDAIFQRGILDAQCGTARSYRHDATAA